MAPMASSSRKPADSDVPIEEIVFSCTICQATVSEVYATIESNRGFHSGSGDEDGIVTKMWITECSHITCAKHLENGAAPFHPKGLAPRATCPKCLRDKGDGSLKELYGIRGLDDGEYDSTIPSEWRQCPAIKLDSSIPGMSAVRFQYMALCHYSLQVRKYWKSAVQKQSAMETAYSKERKQRRQLQSELQELKQRIETLEKAEARLKKWEERRPVIDHYVGALPRMARDMDSMRKQLLHFGIAVPETKYALEQPQNLTQNYPQSVHTKPDTPHHVQKANNAFTAAPYEYKDSSSTRKRKREDYTPVGYHQGDAQPQRRSGASRDLMPPPLPKSKPQPLANRELPISHETLTTQRPPSNRHSIQVYQDSNWRPAQENPFREQTLIARDPSQIQNGIQFHYQAQEGPHEYSPYAANVHRNDSDFRKSTATNGYAAQSYARHAIQSQRLQRNPVYSAADYGRPIANELVIPQEDVHDQTMSYNSGYRQILPEEDESIRAPLQVLSESDTNRRLPTVSQARLSYVTTSLHQASQAPGGSGPSLFFRRDERAFRPSTIQQPSTRGSFIAPRYDAPIRDGVAHHTMTTPYARQRSYGQPQAFNRISSIDNSRQQGNLQSSYNSPFYGPNASTRYQPKTPIPQTPRNSQALFHRPDRPPPSGSDTATRPQPNNYRSRVSLPPSQGPLMPMASHQDEALLQVPGIRGVSSQRVMSSYQRAGSAYGAPRNLFSSAGGRRSVRR